MRQWEIELAARLCKIDHPWLRWAWEVSVRTMQKKIEGLDLSQLTETDIERITDECFLEITGEHWESKPSLFTQRSDMI
jgi:hypothetical protein